MPSIHEKDQSKETEKTKEGREGEIVGSEEGKVNLVTEIVKELFCSDEMHQSSILL